MAETHDNCPYSNPIRNRPINPVSNISSIIFSLSYFPCKATLSNCLYSFSNLLLAIPQMVYSQTVPTLPLGAFPCLRGSFSRLSPKHSSSQLRDTPRIIIIIIPLHRLPMLILVMYHFFKHSFPELIHLCHSHSTGEFPIHSPSYTSY